MDIPINKNKKWIESLHKSLNQLDDHTKASIMKNAGKSCASDILALCEGHLGHPVDTIQDLLNGWNTLRDTRDLKGKWELKGNTVHASFSECGCPLVRSGLIDLHPVHCLCSKGMIETVFNKIVKNDVKVVVERSIGNGDDVCEFTVIF